MAKQRKNIKRTSRERESLDVQEENPRKKSKRCKGKVIQKNIKCKCGKPYSTGPSALTHITNFHDKKRNQVEGQTIESLRAHIKSQCRIDQDDSLQKITSKKVLANVCEDYNVSKQTGLKEVELSQLISCTDIKIHLYMIKFSDDAKTYRATAQDKMDVSNQSLPGYKIIDISHEKLKRIQKRNIELKETYGLTQIDRLLICADEFKQIEIMAKQLSLSRSLIKNYNSEFGAKVLLQLEIFIVRSKQNYSQDLERKMKICEEALWRGNEGIHDILQGYYNGWTDFMASIRPINTATVRRRRNQRRGIR